MNMLGMPRSAASGHYFLEGEDVSQLDESELAAIAAGELDRLSEFQPALAKLPRSRTSSCRSLFRWTPDGEHRAGDLLTLVPERPRQNHPNQLSADSSNARNRARARESAVDTVADEPPGNPRFDQLGGKSWRCSQAQSRTGHRR